MKKLDRVYLRRLFDEYVAGVDDTFEQARIVNTLKPFVAWLESRPPEQEPPPSDLTFYEALGLAARRMESERQRLNKAKNLIESALAGVPGARSVCRFHFLNGLEAALARHEENGDLILDDLGLPWFYWRGRITVAGDLIENGGYLCDDLADGRIELIDGGYITDKT